MAKKWISKAFKGAKGQLHSQLGISQDENIPISLLKKIKNTDIGSTISNPTKKGHSHYKVTALLKKRAVAAYNAMRTKK